MSERFNDLDWTKFQNRVLYMTAHVNEIIEGGLDFFLDTDVEQEGVSYDVAKMQEMREVLGKASFGCQQSNVGKLFEIVSGFPEGSLTASSDGPGYYDPVYTHFMPGVAIVPLNCDNGHNYRVSQPAICRTGPEGAVKADLRRGNSLDTRTENYRLATPEEVIALFSAWDMTVRRDDANERVFDYAPFDQANADQLKTIDLGVAFFEEQEGAE